MAYLDGCGLGSHGVAIKTSARVAVVRDLTGAGVLASYSHGFSGLCLLLDRGLSSSLYGFLHRTCRTL